MNINSQIWEGLFIEISKFNANKVLIIGNVYRHFNNTNEVYYNFTNEFIPKLEHLQRGNREEVVAGDFNIYLLKINVNAVIGDIQLFSTNHTPH